MIGYEEVEGRERGGGSLPFLFLEGKPCFPYKPQKYAVVVERIHRKKRKNISRTIKRTLCNYLSKMRV